MARTLADLEARAGEAQVQRQQATEQATQAVAALRQGITALLGARGLVCSDEARERLAACADAATLQRWLLRAMSADAAEDVFAE